MTGDRSDYTIDVDSLPGGDSASRFDGHEHGASVSFFISRNPPGSGPNLHRHSYEETFIVQDGKACFTVGEQTIEATAEQIVIVPARTPHKFLSCGTERLRQISIHPVARMKAEWLE
jgi:mannose-6-phosphate isomerase-like protein (cupin superfamily)